MPYSLHPLLEDRIPPGLADDQVGPLHHHDADKEGCVAGELHDLPLFVGLKCIRQTDKPACPEAVWPHPLGLEELRPALVRRAALTHPLLPVAIFHVVDPAVIPVYSDAQQVSREEAVLSHNHKVSEEAPQGLDHT